MKKVGILGGTFDPPHHGHLLIANEVLAALSLDEIWFMPNQEPPHKQKSAFIENENRLDMLELAIADNQQFRVETIEWQRKGPSYTFETMQLLKEQNPEVQFYFVIGADMIEYLPKWHRIDDLVEIVQFVGVERPTYDSTTSYPVLYVDIPAMDVSSSLIRERLKEGKTIRYLLPDSIIHYIKENHLYEA